MGDIKLEGETRNLESDNVRALQEAFPEVVADGKVDFDKLKLILGEDIDESNERYSFTWPGKRDAIKMAISRSTGTLRPDKKNSKDWDTTQNLFIEGDNLEVLRVLQNSYRGKVKMIYIDPPYNTGHDFIYQDDFKDNLRNYKENASLEGQSNPETAGRYHTNWLNMMYPRLRLAKNLLKDDGVIFISIDDNEVDNLRKICDEIFGESNLLANFVWKSKPQGGNDNKLVVTEHEYILAYARNILKLRLNGRGYDATKYKNTDEFQEERGGFHLGKLDLSVLPYRPNLDYPVTCPDGSIIYPGGVSKTEWESRKSGNNNDHDWRWRWSQERLNIAIEKKFVEFKKNGENWTLYSKEYEFIDNNGEKIDRSFKHRTIIDDISSVNGTRDLLSVLQQRLFSYPKPVSLIKKFVEAGTSRNDVVLDFFAGSATTAHAVMELNAEDGGSRRFIMVQMPEVVSEDSEARKAGYKTIAEISRKRINLAGEKVKEDHKDKLAERTTPLDIGFKAFTLDTTNFREWDSNTDNIQDELLAALETFKDGRTSEDALYEVLLKYGVDITEPVEVLMLAGKQVYSLAGNYLLVCLEKEIPFATIEAMAALKPERVVCYDDGFADEDVKQNALETLKRAGVADVRVV